MTIAYTAPIILSLPVTKLPWKSTTMERCDFQESNTPYEVEQAGPNRFRIGAAGYFAPDIKESDRREICDGVLMQIRDWLLTNAPKARIELEEWEIDMDGPWDKDDAPGWSNAFVNFGQDHTNAVAFKLARDGLEVEFEEEDWFEAEAD